MWTIIFSSQADPPSPPLLSDRCMWQLSEGTSWVFCSSLYDLPLLLQSRICSGMCTDTYRTGASPGGLTFESIPENYSAPPWMALEKKGNQAKVLMVRNWTSIWDAIRSIPAASPPHLRGRTRRDSNEKPAFIRDRLTPASKEAWVEHLSLHPHLEQRGMPPVEKKPWNWASLFSLLQMGASSSRITLLSCILKTWDKFDPQSLKNPLYEGFLCFKRRPHLPRETIPAGTTSYQSVNSCQQSQFEHCLV